MFFQENRYVFPGNSFGKTVYQDHFYVATCSNAWAKTATFINLWISAASPRRDPDPREPWTGVNGVPCCSHRQVLAQLHQYYGKKHNLSDLYQNSTYPKIAEHAFCHSGHVFPRGVSCFSLTPPTWFWIVSYHAWTVDNNDNGIVDFSSPPCRCPEHL